MGALADSFTAAEEEEEGLSGALLGDSMVERTKGEEVFKLERGAAGLTTMDTGVAITEDVDDAEDTLETEMGVASTDETGESVFFARLTEDKVVEFTSFAAGMATDLEAPTVTELEGVTVTVGDADFAALGVICNLGELVAATETRGAEFDLEGLDAALALRVF